MSSAARHEKAIEGAFVAHDGIVGIDEADLTQGKISWISPVARALLKAEVGDDPGSACPSSASS